MNIKIKNILVLSSLVFITNIISAFLCKKYTYSFLFVILTITSLVYHSNNNIYTNIIDKIGILLIVVYGAITLYNKTHTNKFIFIITVIILFLLTNFLYIYGYFTKQLCFNNEICIGNNYHSLLHYLSSFGHHLIIFM